MTIISVADHKAAIEALIEVLPDGTRRLDSAAVVEYARTIFQDEADAGVNGAGTQFLVADQLSAAVRGEVDALANVIRPENWAARADWPLNATGGLLTASLQAYQMSKAQLESAVQSLSDYFAWLGPDGNIAATFGTFLAEKEIVKRIPAAVDRIVESRSYVTTFVTDWDEESAPSPPSELIEIDQNDVPVVSRPAVPTGRNIDRWRVYRTNTGTQATDFQFTAEYPIATTSFNDEVKRAELGEVCPTVTWAEPPGNLQGLVGMPNGIMAGFFGNTVCFSEPYHPYAWPVEYQITTEYPIVGLGVFGQTLVVCTREVPYFISGADSASMSALKSEFPQACVARRSIASVDGGVVYASPDGLCLASQNGVQLITEQHFTREDWQALVPSSIRAAYHDRTYYFLTGAGVSAKAWSLHLGTGRLGTLDLTASAMFVDGVTDTLYAAKGTDILAVFAGPSLRTGTHKTGILRAPAQHAFAWLVVAGEFHAPVTVRIYGDGTLWHTRVLTSLDPVRLPPGRFLEYQVEIESAGRWSSLVIASTTAELQAQL
jgi:hypothetical protein